MKSRFFATISAFLLGLSLAGAEESISLSGLHLCCNKCVKDVEAPLKGMDGVTASFDKSSGSGELTAKDKATAQKAIDAIAGAGYHAKIEGSDVTFPKVSTPEGKVSSIEVSGIHNCCGGCAKGVTKAVEKVAGAKMGELGKKATSFEVTGDFDASSLVKALNDAGFHVAVK